MTTSLGLAATAATLQQLLLEGLTRLKVDDVLGTQAGVTCVSPSRFEADADSTRLNLFLYNQTRNVGRFNEELPSRDTRGDRTQNQALAMDLHYLITAHGTGDFHAEILLGAAMQILHDTPCLGREAIRKWLKPNSTNKLPKQLETAGLADQLEQIRIIPLNHTTDEMSRIWSAIQVPERPGAAYQISVLLQSSSLSAKVQLPVAERRLYALPLRSPRIDRVESSVGPSSPIVPSSTVVIRGADLKALATQLTVDGLDFSAGIVDQTNETLTLRLSWPAPPATPEGLRAGVCTVQLSQPLSMGNPQTLHPAFASNLGVFVLNPLATFQVAPGTTTKVVNGVTFSSGSVSVSVEPKIGKRQRVRLLLNEQAPPNTRPARGYAFAAADGNGIASPAESADTVSIPFSNVIAGTYLARLQVDEGTSPLTMVDGQFDKPQVTV